jgi:putative ABC transport system permease protein
MAEDYIIPILIALFGIYAYAKFITNSRPKEIAVRKILGASNFQIINLLNGHFTWLIIISNIIAGTVVYVAANKWLENFAYKEAISAVPFIITSLATTILIIITVCFHAFKALKTKPITVLKYE